MLKTLRTVKQATVACSMFGVLSLSQIAALVTNDKAAIAQTTYLPVPTKLCSAAVSGNFRDTISVPSGWSYRTCRSFALSIKATSYQLGCTSNTGYSWGSATPVGTIARKIPTSNCDW